MEAFIFVKVNNGSHDCEGTIQLLLFQGKSNYA